MQKEFYTSVDFLNLTRSDLKCIEEMLDLKLPVMDIHQFLYKNPQIWEKNADVAEKIEGKVLAGKGSVKWCRFCYDDTFQKNEFKNLLESPEMYFEKFSDETKDEEGIVSVVKDGSIYTLRILLDAGEHRVNNGFTYKLEQKWNTVIAKVDIEEKWIEIRSDSRGYNRVKELLCRVYHIHNVTEVDILHKFNHDIKQFKELLPNATYFKFFAMPKKQVQLSESDGIVLGNSYFPYPKLQ